MKDSDDNIIWAVWIQTYDFTSNYGLNIAYGHMNKCYWGYTANVYSQVTAIDCDTFATDM